jgi:hypothetical protein
MIPSISYITSTGQPVIIPCNKHGYPQLRLLEPHFKSINPSTQTTVLSDIPWISDKLISQAIHSFKKDKAAGPDEFKPIVLQNLPPLS